MPQIIKDLQQLKGIGQILAKRLFDAGFDTVAKVAQAGEEGLKKVRGINPRSIAGIVEQARTISGASPEEGADPAQAVQRKVAEVRERVQGVAEGARTRFADRISPKCGNKLSSDLVRLVDALHRIEERPPKRSKRAEKALAKVEKKVDGLDAASVKKVRKGLKKARRAVLKVLE